MDISKVISDVVDSVSLKTANGMVNMEDAYHVYLVQEELKKHIDKDLVDKLLGINEIAMRGNQDKINKIIDHLKSGKVFSEKIIDDMYSLVTRDEQAYEKILNQIIGLGIPSKPAQTIVDKMFSYSGEDVKKMVDYMEKRSVAFSSLKSATDLKSVFSKTGLNSDFLGWLNNFTYPATPSVGSGEIALALLMKGGTKAGGKGDVMIDGKEVEVKGSGGRVKGQKGYGLGTEASKIYSQSLTKFLKKIKEEDRPMDIKKVPGMGANTYQLGKASIKNNIFNDIAPTLIDLKAASKNDIVKTHKEAIQAVFHKMDTSWIGKHVDSRGQIKDIIKFINDWFRAALKYYFKVEGFECLIILNRSGKMSYLDPKMDPIGKVKLKSVPSFTSGASTQGATFQIDV